MSACDTSVADFAPALGEHTRAVLEEAGASAEEIAAVCK
jgi:crotonobetainyl-CoA:carnitine CoA-transferase CaiB-like acyl-CoA transferase